MNVQLTPKALLGIITSMVNTVIQVAYLVAGLAIALLILGTSLRLAGKPLPYLPIADATALAYLCGAWWLARK